MNNRVLAGIVGGVVVSVVLTSFGVVKIYKKKKSNNDTEEASDKKVKVTPAAKKKMYKKFTEEDLDSFINDKESFIIKEDKDYFYELFPNDNYFDLLANILFSDSADVIEDKVGEEWQEYYCYNLVMKELFSVIGRDVIDDDGLDFVKNDPSKYDDFLRNDVKSNYVIENLRNGENLLKTLDSIKSLKLENAAYLPSTLALLIRDGSVVRNDSHFTAGKVGVTLIYQRLCNDMIAVTKIRRNKSCKVFKVKELYIFYVDRNSSNWEYIKYVR